MNLWYRDSLLIKQRVVRRNGEVFPSCLKELPRILGLGGLGGPWVIDLKLINFLRPRSRSASGDGLFSSTSCSILESSSVGKEVVEEVGAHKTGKVGDPRKRRGQIPNQASPFNSASNLHPKS